LLSHCAVCLPLHRSCLTALNSVCACSLPTLTDCCVASVLCACDRGPFTSVLSCFVSVPVSVYCLLSLCVVCLPLCVPAYRSCLPCLKTVLGACCLRASYTCVIVSVLYRSRLPSLICVLCALPACCCIALIVFISCVVSLLSLLPALPFLCAMCSFSASPSQSPTLS